MRNNLIKSFCEKSDFCERVQEDQLSVKLTSAKNTFHYRFNGLPASVITKTNSFVGNNFLTTKLVENWRVTNDGVMGGKSQGSFKIDR